MSGLKKAGLGAVVALLLVAGVAYLFLGSQYITKRIGGTTTIELPKGKKLVPYTVQWVQSRGTRPRRIISMSPATWAYWRGRLSSRRDE